MFSYQKYPFSQWWIYLRTIEKKNIWFIENDMSFSFFLFFFFRYIMIALISFVNVYIWCSSSCLILLYDVPASKAASHSSTISPLIHWFDFLFEIIILVLIYDKFFFFLKLKNERKIIRIFSKRYFQIIFSKIFLCKIKIVYRRKFKKKKNS